jgi:hypothetical protein
VCVVGGVACNGLFMMRGSQVKMQETEGGMSGTSQCRTVVVQPPDAE